MRETNMSEIIHRHQVEKGDKIRVSRELTVKDVRTSTIYVGKDKPLTPIVVVTTETDTIALTPKESVTLLERDKPSEIEIPITATHIFWQDTEDHDYYARRNDVSQEWVTSEGPSDTYTTPALIQEIEDPAGEFDEYKPGSFQVLKRKAIFDGGSINLSADSLNRLREQFQQGGLVRGGSIHPGVMPQALSIVGAP